MNVRLPDCVWPVNAELGEGPVWCAAENAVYFVDIGTHYANHRHHTRTA
jgi:sugar lactone lactonase YvrE